MGKLAGIVTTASPMGPRVFPASETSFFSTNVLNWVGVNSWPLIACVADIPISRLKRAAAVSGALPHCRRANSPTPITPSEASTTQEGVILEPSSLGTIVGRPVSSIVATAENVVPKSMPMNADIMTPPLLETCKSSPSPE